jgi:hypothetical protein
MENRCPVLGLMSRRPCGQRQRPCARRPAIHTDIEKRGWRTAVAESRTTGAVVLKMECGGSPATTIRPGSNSAVLYLEARADEGFLRCGRRAGSGRSADSGRRRGHLRRSPRRRQGYRSADTSDSRLWADVRAEPCAVQGRCRSWFCGAHGGRRRERYPEVLPLDRGEISSRKGHLLRLLFRGCFGNTAGGRYSDVRLVATLASHAENLSD